mmetsp:Transcript_17315/g.24655  ORF Transcript_17315/g.24655 Transcript_17315/m.24655 type:complete len:106 (-) Transcript_17315:2349-2666(-)
MSHIHTKLTGQGDLDTFLYFTFKKYKHTISRMQYEKEHLILKLHNIYSTTAQIPTICPSISSLLGNGGYIQCTPTNSSFIEEGVSLFVIFELNWFFSLEQKPSQY